MTVDVRALNLYDSELECPCRYCEERHVGCHSTCKKYADFKISVEEASKVRRKKKEADMLGRRLK